MKRLFIGIRLPQELQPRLAERQGGLPGARWVAPENFHLTLFFLGDVAGNATRDIALALSQIKAPAFKLELGREDYFGKRRPHALYTKVESSAPLETLASKVRTATRHFAENSETRKFTPHVTLAYLSDVTEDKVVQHLAQTPLRLPQTFDVTTFELIESHRREAGPLYTTLAEFPLGA